MASEAAEPIPLPPKSSLTKTILFVWSPFNNNKLTESEGRYRLNTLVRVKLSVKPAIRAVI